MRAECAVGGTDPRENDVGVVALADQAKLVPAHRAVLRALVAVRAVSTDSAEWEPEAN